MKSVRPDTPRTVEVVKVIRVVTGRGRGIDQAHYGNQMTLRAEPSGAVSEAKW